MAMTDATAVLWLPALVRWIELKAPGIDIRTVPPIAREPRPTLLRADIDLAIGFSSGMVAQLAGEPYAPIRHERLYSGQYVCVTRKNHCQAEGELTLDAYCAANHLLVSFSGRACGLTDETLPQLGRERHILLRANHSFTACKVVTSSDFLTVLPQHLLAWTDMANTLIPEELPFSPPDVHADISWHERDARDLAHG